ncbi:MAG: ribonuclease III [Thermoanaerobaculia bacterium]
MTNRDDEAGRGPLSALEEALGHRFRDRTLLLRALTHASFANEADPAARVEDNETLEFLGDSVLGFLVAERLYRSNPGWAQGTLTKARAEIVSEASLAETGRRLGLGSLLRLASSDERAGGRDRDARLADAFEALVAAVFLDGGIDATRGVVARLYDEALAALEPDELLRRDSKSALQERAQAEGKALPRYRLLSESGPDHEKRFVYEVRYGSGDEVCATGEGATKKEAQRAAARAALELLSARGA